MVKDSDDILGCFVSITLPLPTESQKIKDLASDQGKLFRSYIWGVNGIANALKELKNEKYGKDLKLILLKFKVNEPLFIGQTLKSVENYNIKEKAIAVQIFVDQKNFFNKTDSERYTFLKESILQKMVLLKDVVKRKKLDTNMELLIEDTGRLNFT